jgi:hypothetical protein
MEMGEHTPHFIIVRAMKSGTTTLAIHLKNHPWIHLPYKEVHFFNRLIEFNKGLGYYREKLSLNMKAGAKVIGEKTHTYSYLDEVSERIWSMCPNTKLIWIFRDPVEPPFQTICMPNEPELNPCLSAMRSIAKMNAY